MPAEMVSLSERETLLRNIPFFRNWSITEVGALASLMREIYVEADSRIVTEGELIDSIYILADGSAEVTRQLDLKGKPGTTFLALLNQGESIGLKEAGLFSETGERTATVTAVVSSILLKLDLDDFHRFMDQHAHLTAAMDASFTDTLKMRLIKNAAPFAQLTNSRIAWMANQVKDISIEAQTVIFREGDATDACYMIYDGSIEISKHDNTGTEKILTVLGPGALFGEAALLSSEKRNATARALVPSRLLLLDREMLKELTAEDEGASEILMSLIVERSRPIRRENVLYQRREMSDGQLIVLLKDSQTNNYHQLNEHGWYIWQLLNGQLTTAEIMHKVQTQFSDMNSEDVLETLTHLVQRGFVNMDVLAGQGPVAQGNTSIRDRFRMSYFIKKADKKAAFIYNYGGFLFFFIPVVVLVFLFSLSGIYFFMSSQDVAVPSLQSASMLPLWILAALFFTRFLNLLNPLFKIMTIKHFKHEISHIGFIWQGFGPDIYLDTSDLVMGSRWPRIAVEFSGLLAYALVAAVLSLYVYLYSTHFALFFWLCAVLMYMEILRAFNPMLDLEGYQAFIESMNISNLREAAIKWFTGLYKTRSLKKGKSILVFWLYTLAYLFMLILVINWFFSPLILLLPFANELPMVIPGLVVATFFLEIILEIRRQRKISRLVEMV